MSDRYVRKQIALPAELWALIKDYRHDQRIGTETEAVRRLLAEALDRHASRALRQSTSTATSLS